MSMMKEFKEFAVKGNVVDLAVGVIIGAAFGKIVSSLVEDVIMPLTGILLGSADFRSLQFVLKTDADGKVLSAIRYGIFINHVLDFLIVAFTIFLVIKGFNKLRNSKKTE